MKKLLYSEKGAASLIEAIIIFPIVFLCIIFLLISGYTFIQRSILQSTADRISEYISKCIAYPGYGDIVDPFYDKEVIAQNKNKTLDERIATAMEESDPYRYVAGIFGLNSETKDIPEAAEKALLEDDYLRSISFLVPNDDIIYSGVTSKNGYICIISANTSEITVTLAQHYVFANYFKMIGIGGTGQLLIGKSTSNVADVPEMVRLVDFSYDTIKMVFGMFEGGDELFQKIQNAMSTISGNKTNEE